MACTGSGGRGEELPRHPWRNWAGTRTRTVPMTFRPRTLQELVAIVTRAEADSLRVKATGSSMSYSDAAVSADVDVVVETHLLRNALNGTSGTVPNNVVPFALNAGTRVPARSLLHVEGGIKLHALNCLLDAAGLAMPTLGGAFTQSIVGAISTGTHGSDIDRPPIADSVRAIHLVGPGGKEWWIEREGARSITDPARMEALRAAGGLCADASVVYDDRTFNAVLVSLGRMGIVYSVVLEPIAAFRLREEREPRPWSEVAALLRSTGPEPPIRQFATIGGTPPARARFVDFALSPFFNGAGDRDCIIARRWQVDEPLTQGPGPESFFSLLCRQDDIGRTLAPMIPLVHATMLGAFGFLLGVPFVGPILFAFATSTYVALMTAMQGIVDGTTTGADLGEALGRVGTLAASVGQSWIVRELVTVMIRQMRAPLPNGFVVDDGFKLMTGQGGCPDERLEPLCMRQIDGLEFAFDASAGQFRYLDFIDEVSALITELLDRNQPAGAGLSLRFMQRSEGLLAMQQFEMNCTVEIFSMRGLPGSEELVRRVQALAHAHGGRPHWGLIHDLTETQVFELYGENHNTWRRVLARVIADGGGRAQTFSTEFSVRRGLEPLPGCTLPRPLADLVVRLIESLVRRRP